ncbi:MAG: hypothetical protein NVS2B17_23810 [Candidatus Velthaea sp.]
MLPRLALAVIISGLSLVLPAAPALAAPCALLPAPAANPGTIAGTIKCVNADPANQFFNIASSDKSVTVFVPQGTLVQPAGKTDASSSSYRSFNDLKAGAAVTVYTTLTAGKLTATIVTLPK